jgi:flagellin-like hook-associated protein FlgL
MPMRISENYLGQLLVGDLHRSLSSLLELQRQSSSLRRILDFADDPRGVAACQRYQSLIDGNDQYVRNISRAKVMVESTDTALQDLSGAMSELRELILREASALATPELHDNAILEVDNLTGRLLDILNTNVEGSYLFAGFKTSTPPFARVGDAVNYQGDDGVIYTQTATTGKIPVNLPGSVFMGSQSAVLAGTADLAPRLLPTTGLSELNLGGGWEPGTILIRDGNNETWRVDLSGAITIDDVCTSIATATGGAITAGLTADATGLQLTGTGPLTVSEYEGGQAATSLGLCGTSEASVYIGRDIRPSLDAATPLTDIAAFDGRLPLGTLEVVVAGTVHSVDFSAAATIGDLQTTFAAAVPGHELRLGSIGLSVISGDVTPFVVRNPSGSDTATLLGIEGMGSPVRLFGMLEDLKASLAAHDKDAIRGALTELGAIESMIQSQMIKLGGREDDLDWAESLLRQRDEQLRAKLSVERDADVAQVSADLSQAQMSYQASLLVTSRLYQSNLLEYL